MSKNSFLSGCTCRSVKQISVRQSWFSIFQFQLPQKIGTLAIVSNFLPESSWCNSFEKVLIYLDCTLTSHTFPHKCGFMEIPWNLCTRADYPSHYHKSLSTTSSAISMILIKPGLLHAACFFICLTLREVCEKSRQNQVYVETISIYSVRDITSAGVKEVVCTGDSG